MTPAIVRKSLTFLLVISILSQMVLLPAAAQSPVAGAPAAPAVLMTGNTIAGQVVDDQGNPVAGVTVTASSADAKYPIILLPGVMGTELRNDPKSGGGCAGRPVGKIWVDITSLNNLEPLYLDNNGALPRNNCDQISPEGRVVWPIAPYETFVNAAQTAGFNVLGYDGYDWRLTLDDAVVKLDTFIDANTSPGGKVFLVAHSMGGAVGARRQPG